jgi:hypothetical protein
MADTAVINLDDTPVTIEKRGRGRPRGSKNKAKIATTPSSSTTPAKHRRGRPLGSKNKKSSATDAYASLHPDIGLAHPILPQASAKNIFCFFAFAGTQCREH